MYDHTKKIVSQYNPPNTTIEYNLFHGTLAHNIESICRHGFNRSYCGRNGTSYGHGVYFARDASYSDRYSRLLTPFGSQGVQRIVPSDQVISMILSNVIVGSYQKGTSVMLDSPMGNNNIQYDSTVDCVFQPTIFVIYKDYRAYPKYIINYT